MDCAEHFNSLIELWSNTKTQNRNRVCLLYCNGSESRTLTYCEVDQILSKIESYLLQHGFSNQFVGLFEQNLDVNVIPIILGILSLHLAFFNIAVTAPVTWLHHVIKKLDIQIIICSSESLQVIAEKINNFEYFTKVIQDTPFVAVHVKSKNGNKLSEDIAYAIATSGTTGLPKIVQVPHSCILPNILSFREIFGITVSDVVLQASPLTFDPSIVEIFMTISAGATLLVVPQPVKSDPILLGDILVRCGCTVIQATLTLMLNFKKYFLQTQLLSSHSSLRVLALGGEKCPNTEVLQSWRGRGNKTRLYNVYGITEVSSWATFHHITEESLLKKEEIPIGFPLPKTSIKIQKCEITEYNQDVLFIGGDRVCLIDDEKKLEVEVFRNTGDIVRKDTLGNIYYEGRIDDQIKKSGKRINLQQIDQVFQGHFQHCYDSTTAYDTQTKKIWLFVKQNQFTGEIDKPQTKKEISSVLLKHLPDYYQPDDILFIDYFPITHHGKIDKKALLLMTSPSPPALKSEKIEEQFIAIIEKTLVLQHIDQQLKFLDIGGDSMKAVQILQQLENIYGIDISTEIYDVLLNKPICDVLVLLKNYHNIMLNEYRSKQNSVKQKRKIGKNYNEILHKIKKVSEIKTSDVVLTKVILNQEKWEWYSVQKSGKCYISLSNGLFHESPQTVTESTNTSLTTSNLDSMKFTSLPTSNLDSIKYYVEDKSNTLQPVSLTETLKDQASSCRYGFYVKWKYDLGKCIDSSPFVKVFKSGRKHVYVGSHSKRVACVDVDTGQPIWDVTVGDRIESSPCVSKCGQFIIVGSYDSSIYVLNAATGITHWIYKTGDVVKCSPCLDPVTGTIYIGSHDQSIYALNITDQSCLWSNNLDSGSIFASPVISLNPHCIVVATLRGLLSALQAHDGKVLWQHKLTKPIFSSPVLHADNIYVGCIDGSMYCFSIYGVKVWMYSGNEPIFCSPCVYPPTVLTINDTQISPQTQIKMIHKSEIDKTGYISEIDPQKSLLPSSTCAVLLYGAEKKDYQQNINTFLYCIDATHATLKWKFKTDSRVYATPIVTSFNNDEEIYDKTNLKQQDPISTNHSENLHKFENDVVLTCSTKGILYMLCLKTGKSMAKYFLPHEVFSSTVAFNGSVLVGCRNNFLYCFGIKELV